MPRLLHAELLQHLLGDIPSPPALGATQASLDDWRLSLALFVLLPAAGAAAFLGGAVLAGRAPDYRATEEQQQEQQAGAEPPPPLPPLQQQQQQDTADSSSGSPQRRDLGEQQNDELLPLAQADALGALDGKNTQQINL